MTAEPPTVARRMALFAYGFRPFFLLAGLFAVGSVSWWLVALPDTAGIVQRDAALAWHRHEMLFGFLPAAVAGFMLTAVPSWTGRRGYAGWPLAGLAAVWLAARVAMLPALGLPPLWAAALDLAFLPLLMAMIAPALLRAGINHNFPFLLVLAALAIASLLDHLELMGLWPHAGAMGRLLAVDTMLILLALVGGRVTPAFTVSGLRQAGRAIRITPASALDTSALLSLLLILVVDLGWPGSRAAGIVALAAALLHAARLSRWQGHRSLGAPIVAILHLAYTWIPLGLALKAAWLLSGWPPGAHWLHAFSVGAFATTILAVMTRAALGHTGRPITAAPVTVIAYFCISAAALTRVFGPALAPGHYPHMLMLSGVLWILAFVCFLWVYAPILVYSRADGKPG